ncbi:hypothetical protein, partial [Rhizobium johnstonii]
MTADDEFVNEGTVCVHLGKVKSDVLYLSAMEEAKYYVAQDNAEM